MTLFYELDSALWASFNAFFLERLKIIYIYRYNEKFSILSCYCHIMVHMICIVLHLLCFIMWPVLALLK